VVAGKSPHNPTAAACVFQEGDNKKTACTTLQLIRVIKQQPAVVLCLLDANKELPNVRVGEMGCLVVDAKADRPTKPGWRHCLTHRHTEESMSTGACC